MVWYCKTKFKINPSRLETKKEKSYCYNLKTLRLINKKNLVLRLTQENLIENFVQDCLPYILITHSLCSTTLAYPKCVRVVKLKLKFF